MSADGHPFARTLGIALVVGVLAFAVWTGGNALRDHLAGSEPSHAHSVLHKLDAVEHEASPVFATPMVVSAAVKTPPRTMKTYYARRAYLGAPPVVPHEISIERLIGQNCNTCHEKGGFVPEWNAYTPMTPHPEFSNCLQCHAPGSVEPESGFGEHAWAAIDPPPLHRPALPGAPPPVPHSMRMRENCLACHAGPAAPLEIRTSHPERVNCVQCHVVPDDARPLFERMLAIQK